MAYSEHDTRAKIIDPLLHDCGWDEAYIRREHYFTDGRKLVGNKRGDQRYLDYLLRYQNLNLAIIEAKKLYKGATDGLQQAIDYAQALQIRFVYATDGEELYEYDVDTGKGEYINKFPTPEELYSRYFERDEELKQKLLSVPSYLVGDKKPRYYQELAVNRTLEAIADGKKRILLTLATGTGKTFISFQIVHKLFKGKWNIDGTDRRPRVLFLADRNVLADQAINTFNDPYEKDLVKINGEEIKSRNGKVPTNAYIFFAIYQAIAEKENIEGYYQSYPKDFFDLIVIDECHRGSANEQGTWRNILDYFDCAVHLGLTATPKRRDNVDTYKYFGKPIYEYSLKQGINDGFLTPYKVKRIRTNIDEYIPTADDQIIHGELDKDIYEVEDFNRSLVIKEREALIAKAILDNISPMDKTIVFCVDQSHAALIRDTINMYKLIADSNYCVRVTANEGLLGRKMLEDFQDNDKDIPVIITSSQMLTTGVDARNVRNIVLVRPIQSMVEFKQIVGRGTRVYDGKDFFTIIDFTGATNKFYDDEWDGIPEEAIEESYNLTTEDDLGINEQYESVDEYKEAVQQEAELEEEEKPKRRKALVKLSNGREIKIIDIETRYIDEDGRPLTATQFLEKILGQLPEFYDTEKQLREIWANPDTRKELLTKLAEYGIGDDQLETLQQMFDAEDSDIFDVLAYISFNKNVVLRKERVKEAKHDSLMEVEYKDNEIAKDFLSFILERYEKDGVKELERESLIGLIKIKKIGTISDAAKVFGGQKKLLKAFYKLQKAIYRK